jgi:regulatory protein
MTGSYSASAGARGKKEAAMTASDRPRRRGPRKATPAHLENAALHYLARFASSGENLRRLLLRKVARSASTHGTDPEAGAAAVEALLRRLRQAGLLDDRLYAEARARSLGRRGISTRFIRARLMAKGVDAETAGAALAALAEETADPELTAAAALARRRRLGPYRPAADRAANRTRDLAALARAGFAYDLARRVVEAGSPEELEALAAGDDPP